MIKKPVFNYAPGSDRLTDHFLFEAVRNGYSVEEWRNQSPVEGSTTTKLKFDTGKSKRTFKFYKESDADYFHDSFDNLVATSVKGMTI